MNRYKRHIILSEIGLTGQEKLSNAKVLVVGAGGLGCPILQYLAGAGIGTLGIIDFDTVEESNLQRQVLFGTSSLGQNKAIAAKKRLEDLNSTIKIVAYPEKLTPQNTIELFENYDIIVDGSDNFATRYLINDASILTNKPMVFGAIHKFEGQVSVFNYENGPSYRCLFPKESKKNEVGNCSEIGVLGVLPGIIGTLQANEVLKIILGIGKVISGKLLYFNALTLETTTLKIKKSEQEILNVLNSKASFSKQFANASCDFKMQEISIKDIQFSENIQFIDVRETDELPKISVIEVTSIPLSQLESSLDKINSSKQQIIFCQSGMRSKKAVLQLRSLGFQNCWSLIEGASAINNYLTTQKQLTND